jgi:hypothetical protein
MAETVRWEYTLQIVGASWKGTQHEEVLEALNRLGDQGWEVFSVENLQNSSKVRVVAKRPLSSSIRRRQSWP